MGFAKLRTALVVATAALLAGGCQAFLSFTPDAVADGGPNAGDAGASPDGTDASANDANDASSATYAAAVLTDAPLLYLRLGEKSGSDARDSSGHDRTGTYYGPPKLGVPGALARDSDTSAQFDATLEQRIEIITAPSSTIDFPQKSPFSLEAWVRVEGAGPGAFSMIVGRDRWLLFVQGGVLKFERGDGTALDPAHYQAQLPADRFSHVVATFDGTVMLLYVDAVPRSQYDATVTLPASTEPIVTGRYFPGTLDEVAVYDHALSPERIKAHFDAAH